MIGNITSKNILYHYTKTSSQPARRLLWTAKSNALPFYVMVLSAHGSVGHMLTHLVEIFLLHAKARLSKVEGSPAGVFNVLRH